MARAGARAALHLVANPRPRAARRGRVACVLPARARAPRAAGRMPRRGRPASALLMIFPRSQALLASVSATTTTGYDAPVRVCARDRGNAGARGCSTCPPPPRRVRRVGCRFAALRVTLVRPCTQAAPSRARAGPTSPCAVADSASQSQAPSRPRPKRARRCPIGTKVPSRMATSPICWC